MHQNLKVKQFNSKKSRAMELSMKSTNYLQLQKKLKTLLWSQMTFFSRSVALLLPAPLGNSPLMLKITWREVKEIKNENWRHARNSIESARITELKLEKFDVIWS